MLKMSKLNRFLLLVLAVSFLLCDFTLAVERKCAEYNEYCQEHWECCSNTCLSYSYRCVGKKRPTFNFDRPTLTLDQLLESIAAVNMIPANTYDQSQIDNENKKSGITMKHFLNVNSEWGAEAADPVLQDRFGAVKESGDSATSSNATEYILFALQPQVVAIKGQPKQLEQQSAAVEDDAATTVAPIAVKAKDEGETGAKTDNVPTVAMQCKEIGEKCYRHEECCSQRCHGFLHQCVT